MTAALSLSSLTPFWDFRRERLCRPLRTVGLAVLACALPNGVQAQRADSVPMLGLGASSAFGFHVGAGQIKHASLGTEVGGALDLGHVVHRRVRLSVGLDYLGMLIDRTDSLGVRERGAGYVFTALADVNVIPSLSRRVSPYGGMGFGVDAVGTTISNEQIGTTYNTNVFDLHAQVGALYRVTPRGYVSLEARATGARVVRRLSLRVGYSWLYNQLSRNR